MLDEKFDLNQISSNIIQHRPTSSNIANKRFQHFGSNMLDDVGSNMLEPFALGFTFLNLEHSEWQTCFYNYIFISIVYNLFSVESEKQVCTLGTRRKDFYFCLLRVPVI